jgi:2-polyprenyl-3-methyl-5-hydroxy-6-metoxy-1,4-benzoquinol methylase
MIIENGVPTGNLYPKYSTRNPVARFLVNTFLSKVDTLVEQVNPSDIYEVGCGEGYLISRYASKDIPLKASDFSKQIITLARNIAESRKLPVEFNVKSIYSLESREDSANLILCCEVFEHLEYPERALEVLATVAKPYLILSVPREPVWRALNMVRGRYLSDLGNTPGHIQHWSKQGIVNLLSSRFEVLEVFSPLPWTVVLARVKE